MEDVLERIMHRPMGIASKDISVWIIDDHHDFREALQELLSDQPDMTCTISLASCERLLDQIHTLEAPDVVLMDINFKGRMSGTEGIRELRKIIPDIKVILLSMYMDVELVFDSLRSGAFGYLFKMGNPEHIIESVRNIVQHGMLPPPQTIATPILDVLQKADKHLQLTKEEIQLLELLKQGLTYKQIPHHMHMDQETVDLNLLNIYYKLHNSDHINPEGFM